MLWSFVYAEYRKQQSMAYVRDQSSTDRYGLSVQYSFIEKGIVWIRPVVFNILGETPKLVCGIGPMITCNDHIKIRSFVICS